MSSAVAGNSIRAPRDTNLALIEPDFGQLGSFLSANVPSALGPFQFQDPELNTLRELARREAVSAALTYTSQYLDCTPSIDNLNQTKIVLTGHQPELFHPGVWFKNFLASSLALHSSQTIAINFLVDSDLCRSCSVRVPYLLNDGRLAHSPVEFDLVGSAVPWELHQQNSPATLASFSARLRELLASVTDQEPIAESLFRIVIEEQTRNSGPIPNLGATLALARHRLESQMGLKTLEVPFSLLTQTRSFAAFSIQILRSLRSFSAIYNTCREAYRFAHKIRSAAQPIPNLQSSDSWLEAPWWIYRSSAPTRNAMWVRSEKNHLLLSDRVGWETAIELSSDINKSIDQWLALSKLGVCLRPRALLTTMFSRLLISDLFVHGIGGAKYDQITDAIVREFFQVQPRPIAIATATMHFPFDRIDSGFRHMVLSAPATKIELKQKQRQAEYHPELLSFDTKDPDIGLLAEKKRQLLANIPLRGNRWEWHHEISSVNQQLRLLQDERLRKMTQLLDEQEALIRQFRLLCSREYSFCLFPLEQLTDALKHLSFHP